MADRLRVSTRTARSKGYARKNTTPRFTRGWFFTADLTLCRLTDIIIAIEEEITQ